MMSSILGLSSASCCRHPRIRARSIRFVTMATCSSRLSGSGSSRMQISQKRTPKLYTSTEARKENNNEKLKMHEHASQFKFLYFHLSFPSSLFSFFVCFFFCVLAVCLRQRNVASSLYKHCTHFSSAKGEIERNRFDFSQLVKVEFLMICPAACSLQTDIT